MNQVQQTYLQAKQRYNELCKLSDAKQTEILAHWNWHDIRYPSNDIDCDGQAEAITHMDFEIGLFEAEKAYLDAQRELIAWGLSNAQTLPGYDPIIAELATTKSIVQREKICALLVKLPA